MSKSFEQDRPISPLELPMSIVRTYPTMAVPRSYWQINRGGQTIIIDLYSTRNHMYRMYQRYMISAMNWRVIDAFMDEIRYAVEPNLDRWNDLPTLDPMDFTFTADEWLIMYGIRHEFIDLSAILEDDEDPADESPESQETGETEPLTQDSESQNETQYEYLAQ